jgi:O-antigen/teichoic acid export membrane protein
VTNGARPAPSLTTQAIWLMVAKTAGFACSIALPLLLVRRLSPHDLGLYKQAFFVVTTLMNVLPLGFAISAFYFLPRERSRQGAVVANILAFHGASGLLAGVLLIAWPEALARAFNSAELTTLAPWIGVVVLLWTVGSFLELITVALQDVKASSGFIVLMQTSKTALLTTAAVLAASVWSLIVAAIIQGLVQILVLVLYLGRRFPGFWRDFDRRLLWRQAAYALPLGLTSIVLQAHESLHHLFVSNAFGPVGYAVYAVGVFQLPLVGILRESATAVLLPRINQLETENNRREILELVAKAARKLGLVYFALAGFLLVAGREVVVLLFTEQYVASWPIFAISVLALPLNAIVLDPATRAHSERFFFLRMRLVVLAVLTLILWSSAARLGLVGTIAVVVGASYLTWAISLYRMIRLLEVGRADLVGFRHVGWIAASTVAAGVAAAIARLLLLGQPTWIVIAGAGIVFTVVYLAFVKLSGVVATEELGAIGRDVRKLWTGRGIVLDIMRRRTRPHAPPDPSAPAASILLDDREVAAAGAVVLPGDEPALRPEPASVPASVQPSAEPKPTRA